MKNIQNSLKSFLHFFFAKKDENYKIINSTEYYKSFGLELSKEGKLRLTNDEDKDKINLAYEKACKNRDFEIDKFWTRAAYFWGFIVVIFTGYFGLLTSEKIYPVKHREFFQMSLICIGLIFTIAWKLVIIGSKHWQKNWEMHIDMLEDYLTGPLLKTVYYDGRFFSVSKINLILSWVVTTLWGGFLIEFLTRPTELGKVKGVILAITGLFIVTMVFGYGSKAFNTKKGAFIRRESH